LAAGIFTESTVNVIFSFFGDPIAELSASLLFNLASLVMPMIRPQGPRGP